MSFQSADSLEDTTSEAISVSEEPPISSELAEISREQMHINDQLQKDEVEEGQGSTSSLGENLRSEEAPILTPSGGQSSSGCKRSRGRKSAEEVSMVEILRERNMIWKQLEDRVKDEIDQAIKKIRANEGATNKEKMFGIGLCKNREVRLIMMCMTDLELQIYLRYEMFQRDRSSHGNPHTMHSNVLISHSRPPHVTAPEARSDFPPRNLSHGFTSIDLIGTRTARPCHDYGAGGSGYGYGAGGSRHDYGGAPSFALFPDVEQPYGSLGHDCGGGGHYHGGASQPNRG